MLSAIPMVDIRWGKHMSSEALSWEGGDEKRVIIR